MSYVLPLGDRGQRVKRLQVALGVESRTGTQAAETVWPRTREAYRTSERALSFCAAEISYDLTLHEFRGGKDIVLSIELLNHCAGRHLRFGHVTRTGTWPPYPFTFPVGG